MCSLRLIKQSLKRSACCFLDAFLLLRARVFPPLAGPPSRKPGGTAARRSLCRIHRTWWWWRPARTRHTTETSKRIWSVGEKFQTDWSTSKDKTRSGASFLDIENLISPSLFWYLVLSGVFGLPLIYDLTPTHSLRVVNERILVIVAVSDVDQVLNAVLLLLGFAALQERRHTTSSCCLYMTTFSWRD